MTIQDLLSTYYLHDSLIEKISYENGGIELTVDFCFWMQSDYHDGDPETGIILLRFHDVINYSGPTGEINDFSILEAWYQDNCLSLLLMDDINNITYEVRIVSSSGMVEIIS